MSPLSSESMSISTILPATTSESSNILNALNFLITYFLKIKINFDLVLDFAHLSFFSFAFLPPVKITIPKFVSIKLIYFRRRGTLLHGHANYILGFFIARTFIYWTFLLHGHLHIGIFYCTDFTYWEKPFARTITYRHIPFARTIIYRENLFAWTITYW